MHLTTKPFGSDTDTLLHNRKYIFSFPHYSHKTYFPAKHERQLYFIVQQNYNVIRNILFMKISIQNSACVRKSFQKISLYTTIYTIRTVLNSYIQHHSLIAEKFSQRLRHCISSFTHWFIIKLYNIPMQEYFPSVPIQSVFGRCTLCIYCCASMKFLVF